MRPDRPTGTRVAGVSARAARASRRAALSSGRLANATVRRVRWATHAQGAGESGLAKLIELHAVNAAGDAALAVSLAGTLFFQVPTGQARGQVALFLLLTMLPFALMAPLIGPFLDRFRQGRRWAIGTTMAIRCFLCWVLADAVTSNSVTVFPAALGCLVASKAYGVTRASAVPRLIPAGFNLVTANSRISLAGVAGAAIAAPVATGLAGIAPQWSLRFAFAIFVFATVLAVLLPTRVDSAEGEASVGLLGMAEGSRRVRRLGVGGLTVTALRCNAGLRGLSGFLTMFVAFLLRQEPLTDWHPATQVAVVVGMAGLGGTLGTATGAWLRARRPEIIVVLVLIVDTLAVGLAAVFYGLVAILALALAAGLCQQLGKLSLDALIQRTVPEVIRTSVFARSETLLQLSWVIGGGLGIAMPLIPQLGLGVAAAALLGVLALALRSWTKGPAPAGGGSPTGAGTADDTPTRHLPRQ